MSVLLKAAGISNSSSDAVDPEGVSFDGSSDYLSRSSDLTGNADGKTFTFSAWVYTSDTSSRSIYNSRPSSGTDVGIQFFMTNGTSLSVYGKKSDGSVVINFTLSNAFSKNSFYHVLVSVNLANTSDRTVYIGDVDRTASVTWTTYVNANIDFSTSQHYISNRASGGAEFYGRLAHVFLDYTYRDLSVTANRRLFIDADGKPSDTTPSSPILYLPMTDAATAGSNSGTGGDFTVNGVLDTAQRAPNQWNCSASKFDGTNGQLTRSSITGLTDGKTFTASYTFKQDTSAIQNNTMISFYKGANFWNGFLQIQVDNTGGSHVKLKGYNSSGTQILYGGTQGADYGDVVFSAQVSIDLSDSNKRHIFINGVDVTLSGWSDYTNDNLAYLSADEINVGAFRANGRAKGDIGEFYFDNTYTDLSTDNPFWDADANRPKPVRQVISETGTTPLIALPIRGDDAGNNLGTGGDFTVNSGPYTGARGGSEFWARSAEFDGTSGYLRRTSALTGSSDGKQATLVFAFRSSVANKAILVLEDGSVATTQFKCSSNFTGNMVYIDAYNSSGTRILDLDLSVTLNYNQLYIAMISVDMTSTSKRHTYIDGASISASYSSYTNDNLRLAQTTATIGARLDGSSPESMWNGDIGFLYFNNSYIDFSQESNRNLFVDQLGYPKDLTPAIDAGTIASPLIYMKFDDTSALGTNSGTGGDFTVNGTVTAGADVDPNA
jgi:hypothetical protein